MEAWSIGVGPDARRSISPEAWAIGGRSILARVKSWLPNSAGLDIPAQCHAAWLREGDSGDGPVLVGLLDCQLCNGSGACMIRRLSTQERGDSLKIRWRMAIGLSSLAAAVLLTFPANAARQLERQVGEIWPNALAPVAVIWPNSAVIDSTGTDDSGSELIQADGDGSQ